VPSKEGSKMG